MGQQKPEDWARWRTLLSEQQGSGQSIAAFCRARGLREGPFYEWRKRLQPAEASSFVAVEIAGAPTPEALPVSAQAPSAPIEIRLSRNPTRLVRADFEAAHLRRLLTVLEQES